MLAVTCGLPDTSDLDLLTDAYGSCHLSAHDVQVPEELRAQPETSGCWRPCHLFPAVFGKISRPYGDELINWAQGHDWQATGVVLAVTAISAIIVRKWLVSLLLRIAV